jgi:hypothetical protein
MTLLDIENNAVARKAYRFIVNGNGFESPDPLIDTREILNVSGYRPADEHILIRIDDRRTFALDLERKTDLTEKGVEAFRAFNSDRDFRFLVDGRGFDWGMATIDEVELREICALDLDQVFKLDREDLPDEIITDGGVIHLGDKGTEHLRIVHRPKVIVTVNTKPVEIPRGWLTGLEIKTAAIAQGVQIKLDFTLDEEPPGGGDTQIIGDTDRVFIKGGERFGAVDHHEDS